MTNKTEREENPFENPDVAEEWIRSVEGERKDIRDNEIYPLLSKWASMIGNGNIVEIGSGQGICSQHLGSFEGNYLGIEPSAHLVRRAVEFYDTNERRRFRSGTAYNIPVDSPTANGVFSVTVWFHLADLATASQELSRILGNGGKFLIITANPDSYATWEALYENPEENGKLLIGKVHTPVTPLSNNTLYRYTKEEILGALVASDLSISSITTLGTLPSYPGTHLFISIEGEKKV